MHLLSILLLQVDTALKAAATATNVPAEKISLWSLLKEGGVLMIPLLLCSIILVYVFVERLMVIRKAGIIDPNFMLHIRENVSNGNLTSAKALCRNTESPIARMVEKGLSCIGRPIDSIDK